MTHGRKCDIKIEKGFYRDKKYWLVPFDDFYGKRQLLVLTPSELKRGLNRGRT